MADCNRSRMTSYWEGYTDNPSVKEMLLDAKAEEVEPIEKAEILQMLPDFHGKEILELGAGIGRFTGEIAKSANHIVAVDFMESFIKKNKELNGHMTNITWLHADVTQVEFGYKRFDMVFTNWLLMYLTDEEVKTLLQNTFKWLKDDGVLFFRESCHGPVGDMVDPSKNPTVYRSPKDYDTLVQNASLQTGKEATFKPIFKRQLEYSIKHRNKANQMCWMIQKTVKVE